MEAKHTPGPFKVEVVQGWGIGLSITAPSWPEPIATVHDHKDVFYRHKRKMSEDGSTVTTFDPPTVEGEERARMWRDVKEANARLFAAAPQTAAERDRLREINRELLEALEESQWGGFDRRSGKPCCPMCGGNREAGHSRHCIVGNSIAKAKGL